MKLRKKTIQQTSLLGLIISILITMGSCDMIDTILDKENLPDISGYPIVGTNQTTYYNNSTSMEVPSSGQDFYGQNATYPGNVPQYEDNGDGTVTDMVSGLMWQNSFDHNGDGLIDYDDKLTYAEVIAAADTISTAGYDDWRVPTIKEQYSLIMFSGKDISGFEGSSTAELTPFINTEFFAYAYGDIDAGERLIDVQCASTNLYGSTEVEELVFGVNFADGRIKGYGMQMMGQDKAFNYLMVRGNIEYGYNYFTDNGDKTITDEATGLMWMQEDNAAGVVWKDALAYAENMEFAGNSDWRLPDAKELQSLVDYTRSPATTGSAAIDPLFNCTQITNEAGEDDFPFYWSSTTHANWTAENDGAWGAYISFGRAMGNMSDMMLPGDDVTPGGGDMPGGGDVPEGPMPNDPANPTTPVLEANWIDVHGAGAQRSDPKAGDPSEYSEGNGPQGDAVRIYNYVRLVRNVD